jgi:hypothetical protein
MRIIKWLVTIFLVYMLILGLVAITFCIASVPALFRSYRERAKIKAPVTSEASKAMIADIDVPVLNSLTVKSLKAHKASSEDTDIPDSIPRQAPKGALKVIKIASRGDTPPEEPPLKRLEGFEVTWYNNDGLSYNTATGTTTTDGITAAVDPSVIPLGSWFIYICPTALC